MAEQILYTLQIEGGEENLKLLKDLDAQIKANREAIKENGKTASEENERRKVILKTQQDQYRRLQKETKAQAEAEMGAIDTLAKKRAALSRMNKELDNTKIGSKRFKELTTESKKLRNEIKGADEATGRFQANVGDYKNHIINAFQSMGVNVQGLTSSIDNLAPAMKSASSAIGGGSKALKLFKVALASTGIGLIVIALGALVTYLTTTQEGIDSVNKVLKPLGAILDRIVGLIQRFGGGLAEILSGNFRKGFKELSDTVASVGDELAAGARDGKRMASIIIDIDNAKLKLAENEGRIARAMAEQREILDDVNNSDEVRKKAGDEFLKLQDELLGYKKDIAKLDLEQAELNAAQNDTSREEEIKLAELREANNALEAESLRKAREVKNKINSIDKKSADEQLKAIKDRGAAEIEALNNSIDLLLKKQQLEEKDVDAILDEMDTLFDEELNKTIEEDDARLEQEYSFQERRAEIIEQFRVEKLSNEEKELEKLAALNEEKMVTDEEYQEKKAAIEKKYADIAIAIKQQEINGKLGLAADGLGQISEIAGKETKVGKAAAIAQATINTYLAASNAFASAGNPILGAILAAIAVAAGLLQVQKIASTPTNVPKFARGGIIGGRPHSQGGTRFVGDDGSQFEAEKGEYLTVVNKHDAARAYMLDSVNRTHGVALMPNKRMAFGGTVIPNPRTSFPTDTDKIISDTVKAVGNIPVVVSETDISSTQNRVRQIKVSGDL